MFISTLHIDWTLPYRYHVVFVRRKKVHTHTHIYMAEDWNRIRGLVTGVNINGNGIKASHISNAYSCLIREKFCILPIHTVYMASCLQNTHIYRHIWIELIRINAKWARNKGKKLCERGRGGVCRGREISIYSRLLCVILIEIKWNNTTTPFLYIWWVHAQVAA